MFDQYYFNKKRAVKRAVKMKKAFKIRLFLLFGGGEGNRTKVFQGAFLGIFGHFLTFFALFFGILPHGVIKNVR